VASEDKELNVLGSLSSLLSRRDWVYSLSLLVLVACYDLALKAASLSSQPALALTFDLMWSDVFFVLGYASLWVGLFAATGRGNFCAGPW
jgi:lipoteichoic acid synthase